MSLWQSLSKDRIIAKFVSGTVILGAGALIYYNPQTLTDSHVKDIIMFLLGSTTAFLFQKD